MTRTEGPIVVFECGEHDFETESLSELQEHLLESHVLVEAR